MTDGLQEAGPEPLAPRMMQTAAGIIGAVGILWCLAVALYASRRL